MASLHDKYSVLIEMGSLLDQEIPEYIIANLNTSFELRPYQKDAFSRFIHHFKDDNQKKRHLLFHMATGSGKTLIMAGAILHFYKLGYRNFLFFVQSTNIIEKTKDNFLNSKSFKYLFGSKINFEGKNVKINEVNNFSSLNNDDINILFTTTQGLHSTINNPKEDTFCIEDFEDNEVIILADEAHHINVDTKKSLTKNDQKNQDSWEKTVNEIFLANEKNCLLEFTATAEINHPNVKSKYSDKLIFDYPLKQFRHDRYSKEVKILQADMQEMERAIISIVLSQYRKKIFIKNNLNIKPVVLFKSKTIEESQTFFKKFNSYLKKINGIKLKKIITKNKEDILKIAEKFFEENKLSYENLALELKEDFSESRCIEVNSKNDSIEKQLILNSLEDQDNEYRAIFVVDMLNEGWDVLNLFDIVRLFETRDGRAGKPGPTTIREAQLIGRGARYCPFVTEESLEKYKRKYDKNLNHELRICEELFYHSAENPRYISELDIALNQIGMKDSRMVQQFLSLKGSFKKTDFYKNGMIYVNELVKNKRENSKAIDERIINKIFKVSLSSGHMNISTVFDTKKEYENFSKEVKELNFNLLGNNVIKKAMDKLPFYKFNNLKKYFPKLKSGFEFISTNNYLKKIKIEVTSSSEVLKNLFDENIPSRDYPQVQMNKLEIALKVLSEISSLIVKYSKDEIGSKTFKPKKISSIFKEKKLNFNINDGNQEFGIAQSETSNSHLRMSLKDQDWYVFNENFGTDQEKYLVKTIYSLVKNKLKNKFSKIFLFRNEGHFKLFTFDEGLAFEPDFVMFLQEKKGEILTYQVFIEPKGEHLILNEDSLLKQKFLDEIESRHKFEIQIENELVKLKGTKMFNESLSKQEFQDQILKLGY